LPTEISSCRPPPVQFDHGRIQGPLPEDCSEQGESGRQEAWPASIFVGMSGLSHDEEADLRRLGRLMSGQKDDLHPNYRRGLLGKLHAVVERPRHSPYLPFRSPFPRRTGCKRAKSFCSTAGF
jgi:hypothetical protein